MTGPKPIPNVEDLNIQMWQNRHLTYQQPMVGMYRVWNQSGNDNLARYRATTQTLQALMEDALAKGVRIRAYGGGWSMSKAPAT